MLDVVVARGDVDHLLRTSYRLRELGTGIEASERSSDVAIEMVRDNDGSVVVMPAYRELVA